MCTDGECLSRHQGMYGEIAIFQNNEYRWLCYGGDIIHSCMSLSQPEKLILPYQNYMAAWQLFFAALPPTSALLLGLGGGDSIRFLQHQYPQIDIHVVEQDPAILRTACEWFGLQPELGKLELLAQEAGDFMRRHEGQHDLIMIDMLAGEAMPACLNNEDFWLSCHQSLSEQGLLVVNGIFANSDEFVLLIKQLQGCFGCLPFCMSVPEHNNVLLIVGMQPLMSELSLLKQRAEQIESSSRQDFSKVLESLFEDNPDIK